MRLCDNPVPSLTGLWFVPLCLPGADVPGFPVLPLRGWSRSLVDFFGNPVVAAQAQDAPTATGETRALQKSVPGLLGGVVLANPVVGLPAGGGDLGRCHERSQVVQTGLAGVVPLG